MLAIEKYAIQARIVVINDISKGSIFKYKNIEKVEPNFIDKYAISDKPIVVNKLIISCFIFCLLLVPLLFLYLFLSYTKNKEINIKLYIAKSTTKEIEDIIK